MKELGVIIVGFLGHDAYWEIGRKYMVFPLATTG